MSSVFACSSHAEIFAWSVLRYLPRLMPSSNTPPAYVKTSRAMLPPFGSLSTDETMLANCASAYTFVSNWYRNSVCPPSSAAKMPDGFLAIAF